MDKFNVQSNSSSTDVDDCDLSENESTITIYDESGDEYMLVNDCDPSENESTIAIYDDES